VEADFRDGRPAGDCPSRPLAIPIRHQRSSALTEEQGCDRRRRPDPRFARCGSRLGQQRDAGPRRRKRGLNAVKQGYRRSAGQGGSSAMRSGV
jgi:hypothetical protein